MSQNTASYMPIIPIDPLSNSQMSHPEIMSIVPEPPSGYDSGTTQAMTRQTAAVSPEVVASDMLLAQRVGAPVDLVSRNRDHFRDMDLARQVDETLEGAPAVRALYNSDAMTAGLIRDDLDNVAAFEQLFSGFRQPAAKPGSTPSFEGLLGGGEAEETQPQGFWRRLPIAVREGAAALSENTLQFISGLFNTYTPTEQDIELYLPGQGHEAIEKLKAGLAERPISGGLEAFLKGYRERAQAAALRPTGNVVQDFIEDIARMAPQMIAQASVYAAGGWVPSVLFMGVQTAGGQYGELTEDGAQDKARAFLASLGNAGIQAPMELLSTGKLLDVFKSTGLGNVFKAGAKSMLTEFVTEWAQKYPEALTSLWAEAEHKGRSGRDTWRYFADNLGRYTREGMYEGLVASVYGGIGGAGKVAYEYGRYRVGKADGDFFAALDQSAQSSKTRERLPQVYRNVVDAVTAGGPVENVYVSPHAMREAVADESAFYQLAETVGLTREGIERAEELGADVGISLPLYQAHIAGTEISLKMRDSVKFRPEDMSLAERMEFERSAPAQLAETLKRIEADTAAGAELDAALAPIGEQLGTMYGKEAVQANINLLKARARIAADWWTEAGEPLTPAQVVTNKWGLTLETGSDSVSREPNLFQPGVEEVKLADAALADDAAAWADSIEALKSGTRNPRENMTMLRQTPLVLQMLGARNLPVQMGPGKVQKAMREHSLAPELVKQIPAAMADPIMVFRSATQGGDMIMMLELRDSAGATVNVPVALELEGTGGYAVNIATTIFGRQKGKSGKPDNQWFVNQIAGGNLLYRNNKKSRDWARTSGLQLPGANTRTNTAENRVFSDVDLVNLRRADPTMYSATAQGQRGSISFTESGAVIRMFRDTADLSTFAHEAGHLFMGDMQALIDTGKAPARVAEDFARLRDFVGEFQNDAALKKYYDLEFQRARNAFKDRDFTSLSEAEKVDVRNVAEQEKLADAFLTYLQEGRAPSPELRSAFRRFKDWLKGLYQSLMGTVQINDDVRGVFDRMLASDADITLAEELHAQDKSNMEALNAVAGKMLTEAEQHRLAGLREESAAESREKGMSRALRAYFDTALGKKSFAVEAGKIVGARKVYAAMDLAAGEGGFAGEAFIAEYGKDAAAALNKKQRGMIKKSGALDPEELAMIAEYESAEAMVLDMLNAPSKSSAVKEVIRKEMDAREAELRREMGAYEGLPGEEDYYSDARFRSLLLELRALARNARPEAVRASTTSGTGGITRQGARDILDAMPVREAVNVGRLSAAEARAAAEAAKAVKEGRAEDALEAKRRQAINHAMVLEALDMQKQQRALLRELGRWAKSKDMNFECQEQILALAQRYGIGGTRKGESRYAPRKPEERTGLGQFMEALTQDDVGGLPPYPDWLYAENVPQNMSMGEMRDVHNLMRWLAEVGSPGEARLVSDGASGTIKETAAQGAAVIRASGNKAPIYEEGTLRRSLSDRWRAIFSALNEFKDQMMKADGYQEIGKEGSHRMGFHAQWHQRINDAHSNMTRIFKEEVLPEQRRLEGVRDDFIRRFEKEFGKRVERLGGVQTPENMRAVGRGMWTAEHVWCMARNMGNAGNLKSLTQGYGLTMEELRAVTSVLTAREWEAVRSEGDLLSRFYERTDDVFRKVYGRPMPDKVNPQELIVSTADGQTLTLPGWYFPISVDSKLDPDIKDRKQGEILHADPNFTAFGPSLARNHTKGRTGTGKPAGLYFDVFERSLTDQIRFFTHAPVLKDFDRITRNPEWRNAYVEAFGQQEYDSIRPMLKYLARPQSENTGSLDGYLARSRQMASLYILGWNVKTVLRQFQGLMQAAPELGWGNILKGMSMVCRSPRGLVGAVDAASPFMADRRLGWDREVREATRNFKKLVKIRVGGKTYTDTDVHEFTMTFVRVADTLATYSIWQGAHAKGMDRLGMSHADAVTFADRVIQKTNASATPVDLTPLQREGGAWRLFTMFMGEPMRKGSRMRYWWGAYKAGKISIGQYTEHLFHETLLPALYFTALVGLFSDDEPDWKDYSAAALSEAMGVMPILSQLSGAVQYKKPITQSTVFTGVESALALVRATKGVFESPDDARAWEKIYKSGVDLAAYHAGVGNVRRLYETAAEGWEDLQLGRTDNPFRLFFRKPKS